MRDKEIVLAALGCPRQHGAECSSSPVVLIWSHHETALCQVDCPLDVLEPCQHGRLVGAIELARVDLPNGQTEPENRVAERLGQFLALIVEISLFRDVIEVEGIDI